MSQNLLQVQNGYKAFGAQVIFDETTFSINADEHIGVIGPNGAGKTTLFKILIGDESLDDGEIVRSQALRLGYLPQHDLWGPEETGDNYLERICTIPVWQAKAAGRELQVSEEHFSKPILSLSGGYRMRIKIIGLLGMDPNLMLLDEPTNYLDLETTILLEAFLQSYEGAFLLISHDREVLRRTTDHILEVETGEIVKFSGNIDDYFEQKELLKTQLEAKIQNQALKRKAIMDFVSKFGAKATKARQAQSKLKSLQKMEVIEVKAAPVKAAISIPNPTHTGKQILKLEDAEFGYPNKSVLKNVTLHINRGDHLAIVGLNGAGKSTLLKGLAGTLALLKGQRELGHQVKLAIFNQHVIEVLNPNHTVYESMEEVTTFETTPQEIRNMAGSLLFSSDHIQKKVKVLSGGEKSRVALGRILLQKVPFLLLDEPTNHLDFQTVEALTQALNRYAGTLVVVSHDRDFIRRVGTKILEVSNSKVLVYPGTYDEYVWTLQQKLLSEELPEVIKKQPTLSIKQKPKSSLKVKSQLEKKLNTCQSQIDKLQRENLNINDQIAAQPKSEKTRDLVVLMAENSKKIETLESEWITIANELDQQA